MKTRLILTAALCFCFVLLCTSCSPHTPNPDSSAEGERLTYSSGETAVIETSAGNFSISFLNVRETSRRNSYAVSSPPKVVLFDLQYENISLERELTITEQNFKLYDAEGRRLSSYPDEKTHYAKSVNKGECGSAVYAYGFDSTENQIFIEFYNSTLDEKPACVFSLQW